MSLLSRFFLDSLLPIPALWIRREAESACRLSAPAVVPPVNRSSRGISRCTSYSRAALALAAASAFLASAASWSAWGVRTERKRKQRRRFAVRLFAGRLFAVRLGREAQGARRAETGGGVPRLLGSRGGGARPRGAAVAAARRT